MFDVDFEKLITWLLPPLLRQTIVFAWMRALCAPVVSMYNAFMTARTQHLYQLNHDSRVFSMQAVFNDAFDNVERRIYITDGLNKDRLYIFTREADLPVWLHTRGEDSPIYIWNRADYADTGVDFIVWVPGAITMTAVALTQLGSLIETYKLASKRWVIYRF